MTMFLYSLHLIKETNRNILFHRIISIEFRYIFELFGYDVKPDRRIKKV